MKPNLILLHGALGSQSQFEQLSNLLSDQFNVHSFNFEGHGGRPASDNYSMDLFANNVLQMMKEKEIERSHIFGYSMGGYVALVFAKKYPEKVNKIMTLGTKFNWTAEAAAKETKMLNPEKIETKVPHFAKMLEARHAPLNWKEVLNNTAQMMLDLGNGKALNPTDFSDIQKEVLVTRGALDNMVTSEESELIVENLPNASFEVLPDVPHPFEKVDDEKLAKRIVEYVVSK